MLHNDPGRLVVYASSFTTRGNRLKLVSSAAEKMAATLKMQVEVKTFRERFTSIYVYYKCGEEEPVPLYCNNGEELNVEDAYDKLRRMMFVLSFHPRLSALRRARKLIIQAS
jgi:hypothetical protein